MPAVVSPTLRWRSAASVALQIALLGAFGFAFTVHPSQVGTGADTGPAATAATRASLSLRTAATRES